VTFAASGPVIWPVGPDWARSVSERLAWATDVMQASANAETQHRGLRIGPRRSLGFEVASDAQERRVADMLLAGHRGAWSLPIWPDACWLVDEQAIGDPIVPCAPAGCDFVEGGSALLLSSVNRWEVVTVATIGVDHIELEDGPVAAIAAGSRLLPLRRARLRPGADEQLRTDTFGRRGMEFDIVEPCDWPELVDPMLYLGHPVLDVRPDESTDPSSRWLRTEQSVDDGIGLPVVNDLPGIGLRSQQSHWKMFGRAERAWYRSLLYTLHGRRVPMWVPSWAADLQAVAPIAGGSTALSVEWAGYTLFGAGRPNRRDVRIELLDGSVFYRRVTGAVEAGAAETLTLSASIAGSSVAAEQIAQISIMALCVGGGDDVEIEHVADVDGVATSTLGWQAVVPDV
jgi:hypothetical protein